MNRLLLTVVATLVGIVAQAQLLTWSPPFPKEDDAAQTFAITINASKGNQGLLAYTPTTDVYVHTGVITNLSTSPTNWRYVKFNQNFNQPNAALQATYLGDNKWQFTINGSLKAYYGVPAGETIQKIAILFRSGNGTKKQANSDGSDMYIPVYNNNLAVRIEQPYSEPRFVRTPEAQSWVVGTGFTIEGKANKPSDMKLYHNNTVIASQTSVQTISATATVAALGNQQIIAEANDGSTIKYDTLNIFVSPPSSPVSALPAGVRDGINYEGDATAVTLVLATPAGGKSVVTVIGDFNNWTPGINHIMNKTADGKKFWLRLTGLTPGTEYAFQYKVDDNLKIADPYAQKILDPYNNNDANITPATYPDLKAYPTGQSGIVSILQTAEPAYTWSAGSFTRPDKRGLIIYELLLRDFVQTHDWKTLRDTISYLKRLGINAIELMPFNEFEGNSSWGYNPDFYFAPDKYYGPKNSLKEFIDTCHKNGIAVIMDIALNHSFGLSPMVQLYFDGANNRPAANNPWYNPIEKHPFNVGYDFNHESSDTRYFTSRVVHWLQEYKIDGFRFDLSKGFTQVNSGSNVGAWGAYDASRIAIWKRYYDTTQLKAPGSYAILEHFAENNEEKELADYGMLLWGNLNHSYSQAAMGHSTDWDFSNGIHSVRGWTNPHLITYAESHDEERMMYRNLNFGNNTQPSHNVRDTTVALKRAELAAAFLLTIPGPKMIWQFGETGYHYSINTCTNGTVNNNCRLDEKPIRWDFMNDARRKSLHDTYSKLLNLRFHKWYTGAFQTGTIERSLSGAFKWIKVTTPNDTSDLIVIGNFDVIAQSGTVTFPTAGTWYDYLNNTTVTATGSAQNFNLSPGEYRVYVNRNVNNLSTTPIITVPASGTLLEAVAFPNPVASQFTLEVYLPQSALTKVELLNPLGQPITTLHESFKTKGKHVLTLQRSNVAAGVYYLRVTNKTATKIIKLTLQ